MFRYLLVGLLAVVFALIGGWWTWNWWSYERHQKQIEVVAINSAASLPNPKVVVEHDGKAAEAMCAGSEFPIFVGFVNNSSRTVESIVIDVTARLPERSTNILTYGSRVEMDRIRTRHWLRKLLEILGARRVPDRPSGLESDLLR